MQLKNRVILITGGAQRVGRAIALALAPRRARIIISYRTSARQARLTVQALTRRGAKAEALQADVSKADDVRRLIDHIGRSHGRLDVLINNAAVFYRTPLHDPSEREWDHTLDTNLKGPFLCALYASRLMRRRGGGKIITVADWAGIRPYRDYLPYCVSKAGVLGLTRALAKELAPTIQVNAVAPGPVLPPMDMRPSERARVAQRPLLKRWGSPLDIANTVLFLIEGTDFMTGSTVFVDGGQLIA